MVNSNNTILDAQTQRTKGVDALNSNIEAAKATAQMIKSTLGPMGMDKMLIDSVGDTIITNDGVKILKEMEIEHPGAKMLVEVAKTQESEVGDGTTTAVILSAELLSNAQKLIEQKIHQTLIIRGYKIASKKALEILKNNSKEIKANNEKILKQICETAITGKVAESAKEKLSGIIYEAVKIIGENKLISKKTIKIQKIPSGDISQSSIIKGIVLDKNLANPNMPKIKMDAKVLLINFPLEVRELDNDAQLQIRTPQDYKEFITQEEEFLKNLALKIKEIKADAVICQKGIDDNVAYYLAKENIMAVSRTRKSDMEKLSLALNKPIINSFEDLDNQNLGEAKQIKVKEVIGENYIFIEGMKNPKAITLFLKSSTTHILDEVERAVEDAIGDINSILKSKRIVAGGGAIEVELYKNLLEYSRKFEGKQQLVIEKYAKSFLIIPRVLCENCGFDEIEFIAKLISKHQKNKQFSGIDGYKGIIEDTMKAGIIEPINIKEQAIKSATEISSMILRIDDIIAAKALKQSDITVDEM